MSERISLVPMLVGIGIGGLGAIGVAAWLMGRDGVADASVAAADPESAPSGQATGGSPSAQSPSGEVAADATASPTGSAGSAASGTSTPGASAVAEMFGRDSAADGEPGSIYIHGKPSGVIVVLPAEFKNRLAVGGEGFTAGISTKDGVANGKLSFRVTPRSATATEVVQLNAGELTHACGKTLLAAPAWDAGQAVTWEAGAKRGRVWRGKGTYGGGERERLAYVLATIVGEHDVVGCGAWNADSPDLEPRVAAALKSVRLGEAPRTDVNGL